jgi:hypothetical protein
MDALDAMPQEVAGAIAPPGWMENFISIRHHRAEIYWRASFAPLLDETVS